MNNIINLLETELEIVKRRIKIRNGSCFHDETNKLNILDGQVRGLEKAIKIVKQSNNSWIPVNERLPDKEKEYLVQTDNGMMLVNKFYGYGEECQGFKDYPAGVWEVNAYDREVIAWQPLPEEYKEGEKL